MAKRGKVRNGWKADIMLSKPSTMRTLETAFLLMITALMSSLPASATAAADEHVSVHFRHGYAICIGFCSQFDLTVSATGQVVAHSDWTRETHRYQVSARELNAFRTILNTIRPLEDTRLDEACEPSTLPDGSFDPLDESLPDDLEVRWIGRNRTISLTSCAYTHRPTRQVVIEAVRALGVSLFDGRRANAAVD